MILFNHLQEEVKTVTHFKARTFLTVIMIVLIFSLLSLYLWHRQPVMQTSVSEIKVFKIQELKPTKYSLRHKGISAEKVEDILVHPEKYRYVSYKFTFKNNSPFIQTVYEKIQPSFSNEMKQKIIWHDSDIFFQAVYPSISITDQVHLLTLIELNDNESEEQLVNLAKKDRFQITFRLT
jgi:hypothetical protein